MCVNHPGEVSRMAVALTCALLMAIVTQGCVTDRLVTWAQEPIPRSDVIGVVEGIPTRDVLIIRVTGEANPPDGFYEVPVVRSNEVERDSVPLVPLGARDAAAVQAALDSGATVAQAMSLENVRFSVPVREFERSETGLRPINRHESKYLAVLSALIDSPDGGAVTCIRLETRGANGEMQSRGTASLPSSRRSGWRRAGAIVAAPFTLALDIATLPIMFVGATLASGS